MWPPTSSSWPRCGTPFPTDGVLGTRLSPPPDADWPTSESRCFHSQGDQEVRATSSAALAAATSPCSANRWSAGQSTHHPPAHHAELCSPDAKARGCGLSRCLSEPRDPGQSQHPPHGLHSRGLSTAATRHIVKRLEFRHCPKHAGWLNLVLRLSKGWRKSSSAY